ncbi:hypothetical protein FS837_001193, partial [Tulasnella sp. UAMH 9824]
MPETINKEAGRSTSAQQAAIDEVEESMKHLRIYPRKVLGSLFHLRIDKARIEPIGSEAREAGGSADVELAILAPAQAPSSSEPHDTEYVAVKKLRLDKEILNNRAFAPFAHEVGLLNDLSHDNIVKIIGFVEDIDKGIAWMLFSWEKNGNLREFVRSANWELPERVSLLNILVNSEHRAIITDFGSARAIDLETETAESSVDAAEAMKISSRTTTELLNIEPPKAEVAESGELITMTGPAWTVRWAAPELLRGNLPGLESDIWAFGWICWEAVTGNFPFDEEKKVDVIRRIVTNDLPTLRDNTQLTQFKRLCSLMEDCLRLDADQRPPAFRCQQVISFMDRTIPLRRSGDGLAITPSSGLLHALGWIQLHNGVMAKAQEYFQQSLEVSKSAKDQKSSARTLKAIGDVYCLQNEYSKAEGSYIQSRDFYSKLGDQLGLAHSVKGLGDVYRLRTERSKAEESYIQARDIYSKLGDQLGLAESLWALGDVYRMRSEYSKAE